MGLLDDGLNHLAGESFLVTEAGRSQGEEGLQASGVDETSAADLNGG